MIVAVIPAAGLSSRMGRPKPTLPIDGRPLITRVVDALRNGGVELVLTVAPPSSRRESSAIVELAESAGSVAVAVPEETPDMRASFEFGLAQVEAILRHPAERVLICPGDAPDVSPSSTRAVIEAGRGRSEIVLPAHLGKRGHPLSLPWDLAREVRTLPAGVGVNALLDRHASRILKLIVDDPGVLLDLDTPEDYARRSGSKPL